MFETTYKCPGEAETKVMLLFGGEYRLFIADHRNVTIVSTSSEATDLRVAIPVDGAICDSCNLEIGDAEPLSLTNWGVRCWPCTTEWILPYIKK